MADEKSKFDLNAAARRALRGFRKYPSAAAEQVPENAERITVTRATWQSLCDSVDAARVEAARGIAGVKTDSEAEPSKGA